MPPPYPENAFFRATHDLVGISPEAAASLYKVDLRSMRRMMTGKKPLPQGLEDAATHLADAFVADVIAMVNHHRSTPGPVTLTTYATDEDYATHHPTSTRTAGWHRRVTFLAHRQLSADGRSVTITYHSTQ